MALYETLKIVNPIYSWLMQLKNAYQNITRYKCSRRIRITSLLITSCKKYLEGHSKLRTSKVVASTKSTTTVQ